MTLPRSNPRISFQVKVLVPVLVVMALLMLATIWIVNRRLDEQMRQNADGQLETAANLFNLSHERQSQALLALYRNIKHEPRFMAVTRLTGLDGPAARDGAAVQLTVAQTLSDYMQEMINGNQLSVASLTLLADRQNPLLRTGDFNINTNEFRLRSAEAVRQAATQGEARGDTIFVGMNLFEIVSVPVSVNDETTCVLTLGQRIGSEQARETRRMTQSEIVLLADGQVVATSLQDRKLLPTLVSKFNALAAPQASKRDAELQLPVGGHYLCRAGHLESLGGDERIGFLLLSSYENAWRAMRAMQQLLLVVGLLGIAVGGAIVWYLIRRVTQPLRELRDSAEAVGRGDLSQRVEVVSGDECGELAGAFNEMIASIKSSREELEKTVETLKATQHQLIQSEKLAGIGEFVAGVAHELNNPLTSVMGFSELLQTPDVPEQHRRYLDMIFKSAKRCQKIVQSLLSFARRHSPERKVVSVNEIVESSVDLMHYQMRTSNIEVVTELAPDLPAAELDPHQIQQVFLNIINNARQAMEGRSVRGRLRIATQSAGGRIHVIFQDNGPGIAPENIKRIFNPFFTTKEVGKGTGLGLSLCYGMVSEHGGSISASSNPGEGATFVIELPATAQSARPDEKSPVFSKGAENSTEGAGKRVLVVDDEEMILQMIREVLARQGYEVEIVRDGETALNRLAQQSYDLTLCDWKMPGLNGRQVYEKLSTTNPEMSKRFIFISGDVVNDNAQEFLRKHNKVCLPKPFTLMEFRSAIEDVLKGN